ncbi:WecB/TagA/CpsF family glycosyltransferase [Phenylobacterium sp.]|jgi:exopolysaccharide biosynthesis WecB/TagA/CpsF family protein|uniref:WecB/TagA/CpsF family glycosyltransferase n=1 Tax=Phenylobacterium sp. TaxID=1871053 RepID=UPI003784C58C
MESVRFLKVRFDLIDLETACDLIAGRAREMAPFSYVATPNAQCIVRFNGGKAPAADAAWNDAWLSTNDSGPAELLARVLFGLELGRVTGADLTAALLARRIPATTPITILGGTEEMERRLRERYGLTTIRRMDPAMGLLNNPAEIERSARFIIDNPAPYIFLVVGTPQAEIVAQRVVQLGGGKGVGLCVGSSLNFLTGLAGRAPEWSRKLGLEWLYRLAASPRTHARRVFVQSAPLIWYALRARLRGQPT